MKDAPKKTEDFLLASLAACPKPTSRWRHYKGSEYSVVGACVLEATQEPAVIYASVAPRHTPWFCRPLAEWDELVPDGRGGAVRRFTRL